MKSKLLLSLLLASSLILTACSGGSSNTTSNSSSNTSSSSSNSNTSNSSSSNKSAEKKVYGLNEEWVVDGQWKLKINSVTTTDYRNQFSEDNPAQVVIIDYTYENIGHKKEIQDLYMAPNTVIDAGKKVAKTYPATLTTYPQATPEGAIMENAQAAYGLNTESSEITIVFENWDNKNKTHRAEFKVPVTN